MTTMNSPTETLKILSPSHDMPTVQPCSDFGSSRLRISSEVAFFVISFFFLLWQIPMCKPKITTLTLLDISLINAQAR